MQVKLKQHIVEGGHIKASIRRNKNWTPPKVVDGKIVESQEPDTVTTAFVKDAVVEVSEATAKKWVEKGWAEMINPAPAPSLENKEQAPPPAPAQEPARKEESQPKPPPPQRRTK